MEQSKTRHCDRDEGSGKRHCDRDEGSGNPHCDRDEGSGNRHCERSKTRHCERSKTRHCERSEAMKFLLICSAVLALMLSTGYRTNAQEAGMKRASFSVWEGMIVAGYVNQGSYVNFGGPSVKLITKPWSFGFGILPTMRIKEDNVAKGSPRNSAITPTAGLGFTITYKHLVVQVPFYYNNKTATTSGKWNPGAGLGYKF